MISHGMNGCCDPGGYDDFFDPKFARRIADRYRERGLDGPRRRMVEYLEREGLAGASVLEVGGGVGELQIEALKRGASRTVNLELSPGYDEEAGRLLDEAGLRDRVDRRLHDIAVDPDGVEAADVVVLHRVVCCYPDYERLLTAAADHARRMLVFSYPRRNPGSRLFIAAQNLAFRLRGNEFRAFAHPPRAMRAVLEANGMRVTRVYDGAIWQARGATRPAARL